MAITRISTNSRAYQYNLGSLTGVTGLAVRFSAAQHAQVHGVGLQQTTETFSSSELPPNL